jgi:putative FmdB family regulatory protein
MAPPLYSFKCTDCEHEFDEIFRLSENSDSTDCPKCEGESFRVLTAPKSYTIKGDNSASTTPRKFVG